MASKQQQSEWAKSVEEFLQKGGQIEEIPQGQSGYSEGESRSAWSRPRKPPAADLPQSTKE